MVRRHIRFTVALALALGGVAVTQPASATGERVRFLEGAAVAQDPAIAAEEVQGYLPADTIERTAKLPAPPQPGTPGDRADVSLFNDIVASASATRWQNAIDDDATVYPRFADDLGLPPDRQHLPVLVRLLNRVSADALAVSSAAKKAYPRARPFQRLAVKRVCGMSSLPAPDPSATAGSSYPSGHATLGWTTALVMMEVAPSRAGKLVSRATVYSQSRVVCGLHFPGDVEAGHALGAAIMGRLMEQPAFINDLRCARREYNAVIAGARSEDLPLCQ